MAETMYVQCELVRAGKQVMVTSIPERFAVKDKYVKIKENDVWSDGWLVKATYSKMTEEQALAARDRHKDHRKGTDI